MDLQQHAGLQALLGQSRRHAHHGPADNVGSRALDRGIDSRALSKLAHTGGLGADVGDVDTAAKQAGYIAIGVNLGLGFVHIGPDAGEPLKIGADIGGGLILRNR